MFTGSIVALVTPFTEEGDVDYAELGRLLDEIQFTGDLVVELALPSGTPPSRPLEELLKVSREHIRETMGI